MVGMEGYILNSQAQTLVEGGCAALSALGLGSCVNPVGDDQLAKNRAKDLKQPSDIGSAKPTLPQPLGSRAGQISGVRDPSESLWPSVK